MRGTFTLNYNFIIALITLFATISFTTSCADDVEHLAISGLLFEPVMILTGKPALIEGVFDYRAPEADLDRWALEVYGPSGVLPLDRFERPILGVSDGTDGRFGFQFEITPEVAGIYEFQIWMITESGEHSNRLKGRFESR